MPSLQEQAANHFRDILTHALEIRGGERVLLIYDKQHELTRLLTAAFLEAKPDAVAMDFDAHAPVDIRQAIYACQPGDAVVLIQSSNFRLNEFRLRLEIFNLKLKTMELGHLYRMSPDQYETFVAALAYEPSVLRPLGRGLKARLDACDRVIVRCDGTELQYEGGMEACKLNIGDYTGMKNIGGTFPIGEVFTEPRDLTRVNGAVKIFAFADMDLHVKHFSPFTMRVDRGVVSAGDDAPPEFLDILDMIRAQEQVIVREFGLGLNAAMGKHKHVNDITAFERMYGLHLSLGSKHSIYRKPGLNPKKMRYHVDVFADITGIDVDGHPLFADGAFHA